MPILCYCARTHDWGGINKLFPVISFKVSSSFAFYTHVQVSDCKFCLSRGSTQKPINKTIFCLCLLKWNHYGSPAFAQLCRTFMLKFKILISLKKKNTQLYNNVKAKEGS